MIVSNLAYYLIGTLALQDMPPSPIAQQPPQVAAIEVISNKNREQKRSSTENYLPRKLYPGTYKNYCGPTPEITVRDNCRAHGWHGDEAFDEVDSACQLHDISYCNCESGLMERKAKTKQTNSLASLIALRFITLPALNRLDIVDREYLRCVNKADTNLITTGIRLRQQNQQSNCKINPSLGWFCQDQQPFGTLAAFERINLNIFLKDLDSDESRSLVSVTKEQRHHTLSQLERKRQTGVKKNLKSGMTISDAIQSRAIEDDEQEMLKSLQLQSNFRE